MKVLVIDDQPAIRESLYYLLTEAGYEVLSAASGQAGFDLAATKEPDLVFTDYKMPGWNGVDFIRTLEIIRPGIPIFVVTAFLDDGLERTLAELPSVKGTIPKPYSIDDVLGAVARFAK